ncbi:DUF1772 domain-containing protein [Primorskyibacter sp. S187A]|uniref:anthrone oxygenase family protein n=1 Tax=Primorskyibacter sp. S187A TaxID=3415130 RepID=UPI003C7D8728
MTRMLLPLSMISLLSIGAIFGFFYAWVCSTMWGLDNTTPQVAIKAMQAMNASVRNIVFFPAFFLTPVFLSTTSFVAFRSGQLSAALLFGGAAALYLVGAFLVTVLVNVPLNEALAQVTVPDDEAMAQDIWRRYSAPWQFWNLLRTMASGAALLLTGLALYRLAPQVG